MTTGLELSVHFTWSTMPAMSVLPSGPSTWQAALSNAWDVSLSLVPSSLLNDAKCAQVTSVPGGPVSRLAGPVEPGGDGLPGPEPIGEVMPDAIPDGPVGAELCWAAGDFAPPEPRTRT